MANCNYVTVIRVSEEFKEGSWMITSDNLPGLFLAGGDLPAIRKNVPDAIKLLYKLNYGMKVEVCAAGDEPENALEMSKHPVERSNSWAALQIAC